MVRCLQLWRAGTAALRYEAVVRQHPKPVLRAVEAIWDVIEAVHGLQHTAALQGDQRALEMVRQRAVGLMLEAQRHAAGDDLHSIETSIKARARVAARALLAVFAPVAGETDM